MYQHLRYAVDADGIATLTLDVAGKPMNVLEPVFNAELAAAVEAAVFGVATSSGWSSCKNSALCTRARVPGPSSCG